MTTLITSGTRKTGLPLARLLKSANHHALLTSRSGKVPESFDGIAFDLFDLSTHENPFKAATSTVFTSSVCLRMICADCGVDYAILRPTWFIGKELCLTPTHTNP